MVGANISITLRLHEGMDLAANDQDDTESNDIGKNESQVDPLPGFYTLTKYALCKPTRTQPISKQPTG